MISRRVTGMESSVMSSASRGEWLRYELLNELRARVEYDHRCLQIEWDEKAADRREARNGQVTS
jgi:hypothetical protein